MISDPLPGSLTRVVYSNVVWKRFQTALWVHNAGGWNRPVMERTEPTARLYQLARTVAARMGVDLRECSVGGASDGNFVAALGLPVLDGFGAVGDGAHAVHEYVSVDGMVERTVLAAAVLHALAG